MGSLNVSNLKLPDNHKHLPMHHYESDKWIARDKTPSLQLCRSQITQLIIMSWLGYVRDYDDDDVVLTSNVDRRDGARKRLFSHLVSCVAPHHNIMMLIGLYYFWLCYQNKIFKFKVGENVEEGGAKQSPTTSDHQVIVLSGFST